jgi:hypothetical protein
MDVHAGAAYLDWGLEAGRLRGVLLQSVGAGKKRAAVRKILTKRRKSLLFVNKKKQKNLALFAKPVRT